MKKKICLLLLALCLLLTACGPADTPEPEPDPAPETSAPEDPAVPGEPPAPEESPELSRRERDWIDDIEFLREEIKAVHKDPFWFCSEEEFDRRLDQVSAEVAGLLEGKQIYVLTGGNTMSAATRMIVFLKEKFGAVTVSEPTGQFYSFFSRSSQKTSLLPIQASRFVSLTYGGTARCCCRSWA